MSRTSLLLIHGFGGGARDYRALKRYLGAQGHGVDLHEFYYEKRFGQVSLADIADELARYIETDLRDAHFSVVAFSQGGLIFRSLEARYPHIADRVDAAVTVCTPHHGSLLAYFMPGKGAADLRPQSAFLQDLQARESRVSYYAVYNPFDPIVIPGMSGRLENAVSNEKVLHVSHFLTFGHPKTLSFIDRVLFQET